MRIPSGVMPPSRRRRGPPGRGEQDHPPDREEQGQAQEAQGVVQEEGEGPLPRSGRRRQGGGVPEGAQVLGSRSQHGSLRRRAWAGGGRPAAARPAPGPCRHRHRRNNTAVGAEGCPRPSRAAGRVGCGALRLRSGALRRSRKNTGSPPPPALTRTRRATGGARPGAVPGRGEGTLLPYATQVCRLPSTHGPATPESASGGAEREAPARARQPPRSDRNMGLMGLPWTR